MNVPPEAIWQNTGDSWIFGVPVRGVIRHKLAEVSKTKESMGEAFSWKVNYKGGVVLFFLEAIAKAEEELGIPVQG